jgi:formylglycine-generating enzyme required for sulfatase activity
MKQQVTFVGWDFTSIWAIESFSNGGYPYPRGTVPPVGSEGEAPVTVTVPDVSGLSEAAASAAIAGIGLVVGNVTTQYHPSIPAGEVISQTPAPGGSAILGSVVDLVVSLGPSAGEGEGEGEGEIPTPGTSAGEVRTYAGMEFAWVPAGTFLMGRNAGEPDSSTNEDPQHEVTLTSGIWLKRTEVTQGEWTVAVGTSPWQSQTYVLEDPNAPAVFVSWDDTQSYISALGTSHPTISFRLPTEAEWEYSYRGGSTMPFYFGDDVSYTLLPGYAWFDANAYNVAQEYAHAVGQRSPNAWSLYDMAGNVYEWCSDRYGAYVAGPATDPTGATTGSNRVLRGGSWIDPAYSCRAAHRLYNSQSTASASIGFRIVIGIP